MQNPDRHTISSIPASVNHLSSTAEKIALFRSLFRGREEVHARRFTAVKTGRSGYSPVCGNEWLKGVCGKPLVKCADCTCQKYMPVDTHHLADPAAWRCDRRKDALLQTHGYFILRFLAADLGTDLDRVLDTILRTLEHLRRGRQP